MMKQNGYRYLTAIVLALVMLLSSALAAETDPAKMIYTDYGTSYHLTTFLSGYNVIAFGNVTMQTHCMGAVLIEGTLEGTTDGYADGTGLPPSYIKGYISAKPAVYNGRNGNNPPLYVGSANVVTTQYGNNYYVNGQAVGWGKNAAYVSDNFFNFDEAYEVIKADAQSIISRADVFDPAVHTSEEANGKFWIDEGGHFHIMPGANVVIETLDGIEDISLEGDMNVPVNTTITILQDGHVELPNFLEKGVQPGSVEQSSEGMSVVWNFPNASLVHIPDSPWLGHVIAPDSDIRKNSGNYNGSLIGRNVYLGGGAEGHVYRYNTDETSWDIVFSLEKIWKDGEDADGIRPSSIKVQLYADGKPYGDVVTITEAHNWYHVWKNLPERDADGNLIKYTVEEKEVPQGYTSSYDEETQTLINTHEPEKTEVTITKNWMNEWFGSRNRPRYITVRLYANGTEVAAEQIPVDYWSFTQTYTFKDLPKNKDGKPIEYVAHEDMVPGYTASVKGTTITNTFGGIPVDIFGKKAWNDGNDQDGVRPTSVVIELLADGEVIEEHVAYAKDNWEFAFTNLPKTRWEGMWPHVYEVDIVYTVREKEVPAGYKTPVVTADENNPYSFTITNTHDVELIDLSGGKTWDDDEDNDGKRPSEITVYLMADHVKVDEQKVTAANGWRWEFKDKPKYHGGKEIHYTVTDEVTGYTPITSGMNLINLHKNETVDVSGTKTWYHGENPESNWPQSIVIELYKDGKIYDSRTVTAADEWKWSFEDLPRYTDKHEHVYTIKEQPVDGYVTDYSGNGLDVYNTYDNVAVSGSKTWDHGDNPVENRPASIVIVLLANGQEIDRKTVTADKDGNWSWAFTDLPKKDANGNYIGYSIKEEPVKDYYAVVNGNDVTNTYYTASLELKAKKNVNGQPATEEHDDLFTFVLKDANGVTLDTKTNNGAEIAFDAIRYTLSDVGKTYTYTVAELSSANSAYQIDRTAYTVTVTIGQNNDGSLTVDQKIATAAGTATEIVFNNTLDMETSLTLKAKKQVNGADAVSPLHDGLFTFVLKDAEGTPIDTKTNTGAEIAFDEITYTAADIGKEFSYTVQESAVKYGSYTIDPAVYTVKVEVKLNDKGELEAVPTYEKDQKKADEIVFNNTYVASVKMQVRVGKTVDGITPTEIQVYNFAIKERRSGEPVATGQNQGDMIVFSEIEFTQDDLNKGVLEYVITEDTPAGFECLPEEIHLLVLLTDLGNGSIDVQYSLQNVVTQTAVSEFDNQSVFFTDVLLTAVKTVNGNAPTAAQVFDFELLDKDGNVIQTKQNVLGAVSFDAISYKTSDAGKTFEYTIREKDTALAGVTKDSTVYTAEVTVNAADDGMLSTTVVYKKDGAVVDAAAFNNTYEASGEAQLVATKTVNGNAPTATQVFTFELLDKTGNVIQTKQNNLGVVTFDVITYDLDDVGDPIVYTIREAATDLAGMTIDSTVYTAEVVVSEAGSGKLTTAVTYKKDGAVVDAAAFNNTYEASGEAQLVATKTVNGNAPTATQVFTFELLDKDGNVIQTKQNNLGVVTFDVITYDLDDVGDPIVYAIREAATDLAGVTIDSTVYTAEVVVSEAGSGKLTTAVTYKKDGAIVDAAAFNNTYEASGEAQLVATKTVNGNAPTATQVFNFELLDKEGNVIQTKQNNLGVVTFDVITYDLDDVGDPIVYTIREAATDLAGMTIDSTVYTAEVVVSEAGSGKLTTAVTYKKDGATVDAAAFNNTYAASGEAQLVATKTVNGNAPTATQVFDFELLDKDGNVIQTKQNNLGVVTFDVITYDLDDVGDPIVYTIREAATDLAGMTIDSTVYTAEVVVSEAGSGKLTTAVTYKKDGATVDAAAFNNTYAASGSVTLEARKLVSGKTPAANQVFEFVLTDSSNTELQRVKNTGEKVTFQPIALTMADIGNTYTYYISEVEGSIPGMQYDRTVYTATVEVGEAVNGFITSRLSYANGMVPAVQALFNNTYAASGSMSLTAQKTINGREPLAHEIFLFELLDENGVMLQRARNQGSQINFAPISYTMADAGKTFTYSVRESTASGMAGMIMDGRVYTVTVTVTDNGSGTLLCAPVITVNGQPQTAIVFANELYEDVQVVLRAEKTVNGAVPTAEQVFTFELLDAQGNVLQTVANSGSGITFQPIAYSVTDRGVRHSYTIREKAETGIPGMQADERVYTVHVTPVIGADGTLRCDVVYLLDGQNVAAAAFDNTYDAQGSITLTAQKTVNGKAPDASQRFEFVLADEQGNVLQTVVNDGSGITFQPIAYTLADAGKTYTYTVREKTESTGDMLTDARVYTVTVTVADKGDGTLTVNRTIAQDGLAVNAILFNNQQLGSLSISKAVAGGDEEAAFRFTVTLKAANGATLTDAYPCSGTDLKSVRSGDRITLRHGETLTITGLPVGTAWTAEEEADARYSTTVNGTSGRKAQGVIEAGESTAAFINTYRETDFAVTKVWQGKRGGEIELTLYANGVKLEPQPQVKVSGDVYTYDDLPMYGADGEKIVYSAKETYMEGYTTIYQNVMPDTAVTDRVLNGGKIINRAMTEVSVRKVWTGMELKEGESYPAIVLTLLRNGEAVDMKQPEPDKYGWYTWRDLPTEVNGEPAVYTVVETPLEGFATTYLSPEGEEADFAVSGSTIVNHKIPATGDTAPLALWMTMLGLSAACLMLLTARRRRV